MGNPPLSGGPGEGGPGGRLRDGGMSPGPVGGDDVDEELIGFTGTDP